jgi:hypothetical protein
MVATERSGATATGLEKDISGMMSFLEPGDGVDGMGIRNVPILESLPLDGEAVLPMGVVDASRTIQPPSESVTSETCWPAN